MLTIMQSIKPHPVNQMQSGDKKYEMRSTAPKEWMDYLSGKTDVKPKPAKVVMYVSKDNKIHVYKDPKNKKGILNGKICGEYILNEIELIECNTKGIGYYPTKTPMNEMARLSCLHSYEEVHRYFKGKNGYAWRIDNLVFYDEPKDLSDYFVHKNSYGKTNNRLKTDYYKEVLDRAPQSWCYVEERH